MQGRLRHCYPQKVHSPGQQFWAVVPRWALATSPEHLLEVQIIGPLSRGANQKLQQGWGPGIYGPRTLEVILEDAQV